MNQSTSDLKRISEEISSEFEILRKSKIEEKKEKVEEIDKVTIELQEASAKGDHSENAAYTAAVENLSRLSLQLSRLESSIQAMDTVDTGESYEPIGLVVLYSTVRFSVRGKEYIAKVYPEGISDIERRIFAKDSPLVKAMWLKPAGTEFSIEHRITGEVLNYKILEVY